jgi:hypothetical protein
MTTQTNKGIVVGITADGDPWVDQLIATLDTDYPVVTTCAWELAAITAAALTFDEFVFLPQSTEVLDNGLWEVLFEEQSGVSVSLSQFPGPFGMYLGKYRREVLRQITLPEVTSKSEAIYWEIRWAVPYITVEPDYMALDDLPHSEVFEERFGRTNMVCENRWLRRWKGSWGQPQ